VSFSLVLFNHIRNLVIPAAILTFLRCFPFSAPPSSKSGPLSHSLFYLVHIFGWLCRSGSVSLSLLREWPPFMNRSVHLISWLVPLSQLRWCATEVLLELSARNSCTSCTYFNTSHVLFVRLYVYTSRGNKCHLNIYALVRNLGLVSPLF